MGMVALKPKQVCGVPTWFYGKTLNKAGEHLIDRHFESADLVMQVNGTGVTEKDVCKIVHTVQKLKGELRPQYIHVYPAQQNTITVYLKGNPKMHEDLKSLSRQRFKL